VRTEGPTFCLNVPLESYAKRLDRSQDANVYANNRPRQDNLLKRDQATPSSPPGCRRVLRWPRLFGQFSAWISGSSAGVRLPSGSAVGSFARSRLDRASGRQGSNGAGGDCTTRFENAHKTVFREVFYPHHPWSGRQVGVHATIEKPDGVVFRCALDGAEADRWLEIPAWMFDRAGCPHAASMTAEPFVSLDALAALSALLDLALKDRTPSSNAQLSGASRTSHDQNRGEAHVTQDGDVEGRRGSGRPRFRRC
jgi:hypothetical protein